MKSILIVGAGFSGAVVARQLADDGNYRCLVIDTREHIAGNCHTERESQTGVMVHRYGPHIFNTSNKAVWDYVQRFGDFRSYVNRVKASIERGVFSMPINLHTINQFFGKQFGPSEARAFVEGLGDKTIDEPANFEEQALKFLGQDLYAAFFYGYTKKQWGCEPRELPASILKRLPVRFNYDDNYYNSDYQGIPVDGYTGIVRRILDHPNIEIRLGVTYDHAMASEFDHVFYTGPIDAYFGYSAGRLGYRTVYWKHETHVGDFQGNAVINYPSAKVEFTRIHEHKHFAPWEIHEKTEVFTEFSRETGTNDIPYYPKRLGGDLEMLTKYQEMARGEDGVCFLGRLATYRYMDMHHVIGEALDFSKRYLAWKADPSLSRPTFSNDHEV